MDILIKIFVEIDDFVKEYDNEIKKREIKRDFVLLISSILNKGSRLV